MVLGAPAFVKNLRPSCTQCFPPYSARSTRKRTSNNEGGESKKAAPLFSGRRLILTAFSLFFLQPICFHLSLIVPISLVLPISLVRLIALILPLPCVDPTRKKHRFSDNSTKASVLDNLYPKQTAYPRERRIELAPDVDRHRWYLPILSEHPRVRRASLLPIRPETRTDWIDLHLKKRNEVMKALALRIPCFPVSWLPA